VTRHAGRDGREEKTTAALAGWLGAWWLIVQGCKFTKNHDKCELFLLSMHNLLFFQHTGRLGLGWLGARGGLG
jgi:hypothetical protein